MPAGRLVRRQPGAGRQGIARCRIVVRAPLALRRVRVSAPLVHVDVDVVALEHEPGETVAHRRCLPAGVTAARDGVEAFEGTPFGGAPRR